MVQLKNQPFWEQPRDYGWINIRPCSLDNPCPDFWSVKAPTGKVFQADTQTTAVPHVLLKACSLTPTEGRMQINFKYAALFPNSLM